MSSLSTHEELVLLRKRARRRLVGAVALVVTSTAVLWTVVGRIPNRPMKPESVQISASNLSSAPVAKAEPRPAASSAVTQSAQAASASQATELAASLEQQPAPVATLAPNKTAPQPKAAPVEPVEQLMEPIKPKAAPKPARAEEPAEAKPKPHAKPVEKPKAAEHAAEPKHKKPDPAAILEGRAESEQAAAAHKKADAAEPEHKSGFVVQLAALSDPAKADALKAKLAASGIAARFSKVDTSKGEVTRVRVGPFASREEADAALRRLAKAGVAGIVVSK